MRLSLLRRDRSIAPSLSQSPPPGASTELAVMMVAVGSVVLGKILAHDREGLDHDLNG
jgi:hypothetical protein